MSVIDGITSRVLDLMFLHLETGFYLVRLFSLTLGYPHKIAVVGMRQH